MATPLKKGSAVRAVRAKLIGTFAQANDTRWPDFIFKTNGEILELKGDYALIKFGAVPTPPTWFPLAGLVDIADLSQPNPGA
ncbi:MAG: NAD(P)H-quinone oxidoreductase subunit O [Gloeobacterales cyanobacterium]